MLRGASWFPLFPLLFPLGVCYSVGASPYLAIRSSIGRTRELHRAVLAHPLRRRDTAQRYRYRVLRIIVYVFPFFFWRFYGRFLALLLEVVCFAFLFLKSLGFHPAPVHGGCSPSGVPMASLLNTSPPSILISTTTPRISCVCTLHNRQQAHLGRHNRGRIITSKTRGKMKIGRLLR